MRFRLTLKAPHDGQDNFFLWSMVFLPVLGEAAYICDAYFFLVGTSHHHYAGLFSTILVVFTYLRFCAPIESPKALAFYYILLCILNEAGTIGYLISYIHHKEICNSVIYFGWGILELVMTGCLIYYRVVNHCHPNFHVETKHLFSFISRLEVILAIFIPFFLNNISITLTKHSIAFFLLFDFFSESYHRFQGFWIKSILYIFVCTVTVCVAAEWIYAYEHREVHEVVATVSEFVSACLCDVLIIFQFIPYHFRTIGIAGIARTALTMQQKHGTGLQTTGTDSQIVGTNSQTTGTDLQTIEIIGEPTLKNGISRDSIIEIEF